MNTTFIKFFRIVCCGAIILGLSVFGFAQFKAGLQGTITDASGAIVPGANVSLTAKDTGRTQQTVASDEGFYRFSALAPGSYTLTVEKASFKKRVVENVVVNAEQLQGYDVALDAGGISETVTVEAVEAPLQTEDANIRKTLSTQEILSLPQVGRDPYELARLAPGVFGAGARSSSGGSVSLPNTSGPGGSNNSIFATENQQPISANGQRVSANNYQIDGTSVNSQTWGGAAVITPSQESVKEIAVTSSTYSAEDGRNSGAQIKVVTQNGTNQWHGSGFLKIDDPSLNAFNRFYGVPGVVTATPTRVEQKYKTYGGSLGGPIVKNKLFFFFSYEGLNNKSSNTYRSVIDTAAFRQSVIAARPNTLTARILGDAGAAPRVLQILSTTCAIANISGPCQAVGNGFDIGSITGTYGNYVSLGSPSGGGLDGIADLQYALLSNPTSFKGHQFFSRVDYNFSDKDRFAVSTYFTPVTNTQADTSAQSRPMSDVTSKRFNYALGFIYTRNISSTMINEARFNITRWGYNELDSNDNSKFVIPRIEIEGTFNDRLRYGVNRGENTPGVIDEKQLDFRDMLTNVIGNHGVKIGAEYRVDLNNNTGTGGARPLYSFVRPWNFANGTPIYEAINADSTGKPSANNVAFKTTDLALFVQDDWKFRPNLTVNLGLRWEYFSPITARNGVIGNLQLDSNGGLAGSKIITSKQLTNKDLNNFGPQLGFAYSPKMFDNKLVIRGGGGIGYDRLSNALLANARANPPNGARYGLCCGTASTDFGTPFVGGMITFVSSTDGTIFGYPANSAVGGGTNPATGFPNNAGKFDPNNTGIEIYGTPRNLPTAYVYRYSMEGQYELPYHLVGTLGYQGSAGRHFVRIVPLHITAPTTNAALRAVYFASPDVNSNYNAMIARLQGRLYKQFSFDMNYRFSKSLDTTSFESPCGCTNQSYPVDQSTEYGPSDFDVTHYFVASGVWDLPIFTHRNNWKGKVLGGWQISEIYTHHSGFPWTPRIFGGLSSANGNGFGDIRPTLYNGKQPLDNSNDNFLQAGGIFPGGGSAYFSTSTNGSSYLNNRPGIGRNTFRGPRYNSLDMTFAKKFGLPNAGFLGENSSIDVRFNFFNILNTLNLAPFNAATDNTRVNLTQFGTATNALAGRVGEFQIRFSF